MNIEDVCEKIKYYSCEKSYNTKDAPYVVVKSEAHYDDDEVHKDAVAYLQKNFNDAYKFMCEQVEFAEKCGKKVEIPEDDIPGCVIFGDKHIVILEIMSLYIPYEPNE